MSESDLQTVAHVCAISCRSHLHTTPVDPSMSKATSEWVKPDTYVQAELALNANGDDGDFWILMFIEATVRSSRIID